MAVAAGKQTTKLRTFHATMLVTRAEEWCVEAVGGGQALEVEYQDGDAPGIYEVEVRRADGSHVEVHLNGQFRSVGTQSDDDIYAVNKGNGSCAVYHM